MKKENKKEGGVLSSVLPDSFVVRRARQPLRQNPNTVPVREDSKTVVISVHDYNEETYQVHKPVSINDCFSFFHTNTISWINIDGIRKIEVETVCNKFGIHALLQEDILSISQRPKMEEVGGVLFCLLNMLYYNPIQQTIEQEQLSIVLSSNLILSFQDDATRDVFTPLREKLKTTNSRVRQGGSDYLFYAMLDLVVDNFFIVTDLLGDKIEQLEEEIVRNSNQRCLVKINSLRKETLVLKRNIGPVRDLVSGLIKSDGALLSERSIKYFKDVHDHVVQAYELTETYRDTMTSLQDLYISNVNLRQNEVMKLLAIVTVVLAPFIVISGFWGMNFKNPLFVNSSFFGLWFPFLLMFSISTGLFYYFKKRKKWF